MKKLFSEFKPVSAGEWKLRIEKDLKETRFDSLLKTNRNGITIKPFYTREDLHAETNPVFTASNWDICARVLVSNEKEANKQALENLQNGVSGLCFVIQKQYDFNILLDNISVPHIYIQFIVNENIAAFVTGFKNYLHAKGINEEELNCSIVYDSIGQHLKKGQGMSNNKTEELTFLLNTRNTKGLKTICVDGSIYQNAGANASYELAATLSHLNEYLNWLDNAGQIQLAEKIQVTLATGTDFFEEIAKLRAFRKLAALVFEAYSIQPQLYIHCETSNVYRSQFDSYSNLLRDSISGMAAVLGGCNSLIIHAFNETVEGQNSFSSRMSRNQQLIFKEEAYLDKVADVAAGSFYIETLTEQIAVKAWEYFREIEKNGGLIQLFESGKLKTRIDQQADELVNAYKNGKRVLIGVNKFPNPKDAPIAKPTGIKKTKGIDALSLTNEILAPQEVNA
ncbi:MAG TPA: methylmalonyl-CoA mutase family protein [Bacteroidia bacterium]